MDNINFKDQLKRVQFAIEFFRQRKINQLTQVDLFKEIARKRGIINFRLTASALSNIKKGTGLAPEVRKIERLNSFVEQILLDNKWKIEFESEFEKNEEGNEGGNKKEYDIFLASPKWTLEKKVLRFSQLEKDIKINLGGIGDKCEDLKLNLLDRLKIHFFGEDCDSPDKEIEKFNANVDKLHNNLTEQLGLNVIFPRKDRNLNTVKYTYAPTIFKKDYNYLQKSRTYLIISPFPRLFTSAWVELGMAMMLNMPIIIVAKNIEEDIPYIISQRSSLKTIFHRKIDSIEDIAHLYKWMKELPPFRQE